MWRQIVVGAGALALAGTVLWVLFVVAMRAKFRPLLDAIRRMNRTVFNPRTMESAGRPGAYASVIHHVGRTTGAPYATPVVARPADDGFVVVLPYGTSADWLQNVLAAGHATIVNEGNTYRVDHPEVRSVAEGAPYFTPKEQRSHRLYGIGDLLLLRWADAK
jgi:deazaflavin-dependent oxidoreductase (nitroreductase family)